MRSAFPRLAIFSVIFTLFGFLVPLCAEAGPTTVNLSKTTVNCQPVFDDALYAPGTSPSWVAMGDFNGDGVPDLVTAGWYTKRLYVLLGKKNGTFVSGKSFPSAAGYPRQLVVGDFNNDGKLDVAIADEGGSVNVMLGNGDGTFQSPLKTDAGNAVDYLAVGDFNHDGKLDVVAATFLESQMQVMLGHGDGTFGKPTNYATSLPPWSITVADLKGDGNLDILSPNTGSEEVPGYTLNVFFGKGDGTFGQPKVLNAGVMPLGVMAADLNGDGKIDIATADYAGGTATVLLGQGDGNFGTPTSYAAGHPFAPRDIAAVPFKDGGMPGLAVAGDAGVYILPSLGNGKFGAAHGYNPVAYAPIVADFNGDGNNDLALFTGSYGSSGVAILFGNGSGGFSSSTTYPEVPQMDAIAVGDFNGDGKLDVAVGDTYNNLIAVAIGDGKGHFSAPTEEYDVSYPVAMASAVFGHNGKADLAVLSWPDWKVQIFRGNGSGLFENGQHIPITAIFPSWIYVGDFNGDGSPDIAVTSQGDYQDEGAVSILIGNGDGTFQAAVPYGTGYYLRSAVFGDFNGDGILDFALPRYDNQDFIVFLGNGDGTFTEGKTYPLPAADLTAAAGDFNGDENLDLAFSESNNETQLWLGNGDGTFTPGQSFAGGDVLAAGDFNGDGNIDLLAPNAEGLVQILLGNGNGTFRNGNASYFGGGGGLSQFAIADLTGNGALDFLFPDDEAGTISVLLNRCGK
jgi:hypothetical protein